jgi:hypothetical protein
LRLPPKEVVTLTKRRLEKSKKIKVSNLSFLIAYVEYSIGRDIDAEQVGVKDRTNVAATLRLCHNVHCIIFHHWQKCSNVMSNSRLNHTNQWVLIAVADVHSIFATTDVISIEH